MSTLAASTRRTFFQRHLDPATIFAEILFGLIMVLTFTLAEGLTMSEGREGVRQLLIASVGCNFAWGLIDGVMYIMNQMFQRGRRSRFIHALKGDLSERQALDAIANELDEPLGLITREAERERIYREILRESNHATPQKTRLEKADIMGAIASFWLVFISTIPAVLPFLVMSDPWRALRVSNLLLIGMLFFLGTKRAAYTNTSRLGAGLLLMLLGLLLVSVAIALGG